MQYGTLTFVGEPIGDFYGNLNTAHSYGARKPGVLTAQDSTLVDSRDANLQALYYRYVRSMSGNAPSEVSVQALTNLNAELASRTASDTLFDSLSRALTVNSNVDASFLFTAPVSAIANTNCQKRVDAAIGEYCNGWNDYSLKYHRVVVNACAMTADETGASIIEAVRTTCSSLKNPNMIIN